jgi:luciferase family oxidoreductase group 1
MGLPFAFASHFAPGDLMPALEIYRRQFQSSRQLDQSYAMVAVNVFAADTDEEARRQFTSVQQAFINLRRGKPGPVPAPINDIEGYGSEFELAQVDHALAYSAVGSADTVARELENILEQTRPDELLLAGHFYDHSARLRSFEIAAEVRERMGAVTKAGSFNAQPVKA